MERTSSPRPVVLAAVPTPFTAGGDLDLSSAAELYAAVASSGVNGMFVLGTTGEFPTLSAQERKVLVELALENRSDAEVFCHVGAVSAWEAVQLTTHAVGVGATKVAAVTPYYYSIGDREMEDYYRRVAEAAGDAEVYGYSIPSEAKNRISAGLLKNLGKLTNFAGAKVSITSPEAVRELVKASGGRMRIYSGSDATALQGLRAGGHGLVSGPSSAVPEPYIALADAVAAGDDERAKAAHKLIERLARDIGGGIGRIKFALAVRGLPSGHLRAHLPRPSVEDRRQIEDAVESVVEAARNLDPEPHTPTRSSSTGRT